MGNNIIKYRSLSNLDDSEKWGMLKDYIQMKKTVAGIAKENDLPTKSVETFISKLYKMFQQARETKMLMATGNNPELYQVMKDRYVESDYINKVFLSKLSDPESLTLSDAEILFAELHIEYGDDIKAIKKADLTDGIDKKSNGKDDIYLIRAMYLKKKPNVANYINERKKESLKVIENGKEFIQENLITTIEQLKNTNDPRNLPSLLKATEQLARTVGAFDDKVTVNNVDGDRVLDMMLDKAKKANAKEVEDDNPDMIAYVDGQEIY